MAGKKIKGLTVEIGGDTTKLGKALESVNKKSSSLSGELRDINRLLKLDPSNTELLAQKQKVLADAISNTEEKLDKLKEAERQVQAQFEKGEASEEQVRELQREIIDTTKRLEGYEKAAKETADEIDRLGKETDDAADEVDELGREAQETEREAGDLGDTLSGVTSAGLKAVAGLAVAAATAVVGAAEASREYRQEMGKLDTAFQGAGFSSEAAKNTYKELQGVLGETDQAVEAANHLAKLADTEQDLNSWTDILTGVYAEFGASLPIEGLAEAANETKRVGQVTGPMADALNWAAEEGENFGVAMKEATEENEEWNKAVEEATSAEDYFNLALQECSDEQERQQLITKTLTKLYGKSADQYKKTNKQVIEANKANEEWNATMAELGETVEPVVTDVKKFGTELLKNAQEPLKDIASFVSGKFLPALTKISTWVLNNIPTIKAGLAAVTAGFVAYKVATIAAEVAHNGLRATIMATTVAQKALNLAQAATPWGLVATAITGVVVGLIAFSEQTRVTAEDVNVLTDEEKKLMDQAHETATAFQEQKTATAETLGGIQSQMGHVQNLANELQTLADASGRVKEEDSARAQFILNELNGALGTEYELTDGVIQQYDTLKNNINEVIKSKTANAMLEASNADYVAALQAESDALQAVVNSEKDFQAQNLQSQQRIQEWENEVAELRQDQIDGVGILTDSEKLALDSQINNLNAKINEEKTLLNKKEQAYEEDLQEYEAYQATIMQYEDAQQAALEGNYDKTVSILKGKSGSYQEYSGEVDQATKNAVDKLFKEAVDAGIAAKEIKKNFENGVEGYTQDMVDEAEKGYQEAVDAYANAYADAESIGEDMGDGLSDGMENKRNGLYLKASSLVSGIITKMRQAADSNSPSKETISLGEDMGEGSEIGLENKTKDVQKAAKRQVDSVLDVYEKGFDPAGQATANALQVQSTRHQVQSITAINDNTASKLDKILAAIEKGQILTINGDKLVGGTADKYDDTLGKKRLLIERGAMA